MGILSYWRNGFTSPRATPAAAASEFPTERGDNLTEDLLYAIWQTVNNGGLPSRITTIVNSDTVVASGTVPTGKESVCFTLSDDFVGSINGATRKAGDVVSFSCKSNSLLPAIGYVVTSGSIIIDTLSFV